MLNGNGQCNHMWETPREMRVVMNRKSYFFIAQTCNKCKLVNKISEPICESLRHSVEEMDEMDDALEELKR